MLLPVIKQTILTFFLESLNLEGHQNHCIGSKGTAIFLNGWMLPIGGASSGRVCAHPAKQAALLGLSVVSVRHFCLMLSIAVI